MMRAKDSIAKLPPGADEDVQFSSEEEYLDSDEDNPFSSEGEDACLSTTGSLPRWVLLRKLSATTINSEIIDQYGTIYAEFSTANPERHNLLSFLVDNLGMHKLQHLSHQNGINDLNVALVDFKKEQKKDLGHGLPI